MNLTVDQPAALRALSRVTGVIDRKHTIPILSSVLLSSEGDRLRVVGTDMEIEASELIACQGGEGEATTVPAGTLHDILRNASEGVVLFSLTDADPRMKVAAGRSRFSVPTLPADRFPRMDGHDFPVQVKIDGKELLRLLDGTAFAAATDAGKAHLAGVHLHLAGTAEARLLRAVATDTYRLARIDTPAPALRDFPPLTLSSKTVRALQRLLSDQDGEAEVSLSETLIRVQINDASLTSKVFDPNYPDYGRLIPTDLDHTAHVEGEDMLRAVRRALIVANDKARSVRVTFDQGKVVVSARSAEVGEGADEFEVDYDGPERSFGFNGALLFDVVSKLADRTITIGFTNNRVPVLFTDDDDALSLFLLMPFQV